MGRWGTQTGAFGDEKAPPDQRRSDGAIVVTNYSVAERSGPAILLPQGNDAQAQESEHGQDKC